MIGKTIKSVVQKKLKDYDDKGFLEIKFTDGTSVAIVSSYLGWSGNSVDEYTTDISIVEEITENTITFSPRDEIKKPYEWMDLEKEKEND